MLRAKLERLVQNMDAAPEAMSSQQRLQWLAELVRSDGVSPGDKLKAIDMMNKMQGDYVSKVDGNVNVCKLEDLL